MQGSACTDALKLLSSLMFVHEYMTLSIKVLVYKLCFIFIIRFKKKFSSTYTVHIYNVYISFTESMTEVHMGLHC